MGSGGQTNIHMEGCVVLCFNQGHAKDSFHLILETVGYVTKETMHTSVLLKTLDHICYYIRHPVAMVVSASMEFSFWLGRLNEKKN